MTDISHFIDSFKLGNFEDAHAGTGCTVILCPKGAVAGVDVRGGSPATRETDLLRPENANETIHAVVLSGGSAYGLEASCGVARALEQAGIGFPVADGIVPIVVGASLYDLSLVSRVCGKPVRPDISFGVNATQAALRGDRFEAGNHGAGTGAVIGKFLGLEGAMKSGLGFASRASGDLKVGVVVAVNAFGDVYDKETGSILAGLTQTDLPLPYASAQKGKLADGTTVAFADTEQQLLHTNPSMLAGDTFGASSTSPHENTTLACVFTNAKITKAQATKLASVAHDGYARAIRPVHTSVDGDTIFTMASGEIELSSVSAGIQLGALVVSAVEEAIHSAIKEAAPAYGFNSYQGKVRE